MENKHRNQQTNVTVNLNAEQKSHETPQQNRRRCNYVIAAIHRGCLQGKRVNPFPQATEKEGHPQLYQNRADQNDNCQHREIHCLRMNDLFYRGFHQLHADNQNQHCHHQPRKIFISGVSIGMVCVRRLLCQTKAKESHHRGGCIRKVIHRIGNNRNRARQKPCHKLAEKQKPIAENADHTRQLTYIGTHLRILRIRIIFYKKP